MRFLLALSFLMSFSFSAAAVEPAVSKSSTKEPVKIQKSDVSVSATSYPTLVLNRPGIGFLKITNTADEDIMLYGAEASAISSKVEIHTHKSKDGVMRMVKLNELKVPAKTTIDFKDTHLHLMLMDMKKELIVGETYPMTLKFQREEGSLMPIEVEVSVVER